MRNAARGRRRYGQVPSSASANSLLSDDDDAPENSGSRGHEGASASYDSTSNGDDQQQQQHPLQPSHPLESSNLNSSSADPNLIDITILDTAHKKFTVSADPSWTVARFKAAGSLEHGVFASSQRLVYMGRLLEDMKTLEESGITKENENRIVHLFPKPNVVLRSEDDALNSALSSTASSEHGGPSNPGGAHVPQIYVDANEASSPVLVLSSQEMFEAMHRVKLLSFLLLIMSSMELLTLFSIAMGAAPDTDGLSGGTGYGGYDDIPPGDPTDTGPRGYSGGSSSQPAVMRTWRNSDYADLAVSLLGLWVSTLGIKATTESTVYRARQYFYGLIVAGLAWSAYQYYLSVQIFEEAEEAAEQAAEDADDGSGSGSSGNGTSGGGSGLGPNEAPDYETPYSSALGTLMIPLAVWFMCWFRAWEFQWLMVQAERDAIERTNNLVARTRAAGSSDEEEGSAVEDYGEGLNNGEAMRPSASDLELSVQVEGRIIT